MEIGSQVCFKDNPDRFLAIFCFEDRASKSIANFVLKTDRPTDKTRYRSSYQELKIVSKVKID